jgi:uncharacterized membrane protein
MKNKTKTLFLSVALSLALPALTFAALEEPGDIIALMKKAVTYMYTAFYIVAVGFILWAAFSYLQGGTNPEKIKEAKNQLKYAVIAIIIALVASGVSTIISNFIK